MPLSPQTLRKRLHTQRHHDGELAHLARLMRPYLKRLAYLERVVAGQTDPAVMVDAVRIIEALDLLNSESGPDTLRYDGEHWVCWRSGLDHCTQGVMTASDDPIESLLKWKEKLGGEHG